MPSLTDMSTGSEDHADMPRGQVLGYVRVSTAEQNPARQHEAIGKCDRVFEDRESGRTREKREALADLITYARAGDEVRVRSIDRLGHSTRDLHDILAQLVTEKGVRVRFMFEGITVARDQGNPASEMFLTFLSAMVQFQYALQRERQLAGVALARERGVYEKTRSLSPAEVEAARALVDMGMSKTQVAKRYEVSRQTLYTALNGKGAYAESGESRPHE